MTGAALDEFSPPEAWDRIVQTDPRAAVLAARRVVALTDDQRRRAIAYGAMGRACFELGHLGRATDAIRDAIRAADVSGDATIRSSLTLSGAAILAEAGLVDEALAALDEIRDELTGADLGRWCTQRSYVLHHSGRLVEALETVDEGERLLRDVDDEIGLLRLLLHRGVVVLQQGRLDAAMAEFGVAEVMAARLGQDLTRALAVANAALALGRARRIPEALAEFDRADALYAAAGQPDRTTALMEVDRAEVLMHAGMATDAVSALGRAIAYIAPGGNRVQLADARLQLARAQLMAGDIRPALLTAGVAADDLRASGRHAMVAHADAVAVLARLVSGSVDDEALSWAAQIADALAASGWESQAIELRLARISAARTIGRVASVHRDVEQLAAGRTASQRDVALAGWYARAVELEAVGDLVGVIDACRSGLNLVDDIAVEAATSQRGRPRCGWPPVSARSRSTSPSTGATCTRCSPQPREPAPARCTTSSAPGPGTNR